MAVEASKGVLISSVQKEEVHLVESLWGIEVTGEGFRYYFSKDSGILEEMEFNQSALIKQGPHLNVWRAPTSNDLPYKKSWVDAELDKIKHKHVFMRWNRVDAQSVQVEIKTILLNSDNIFAFSCNSIYTVYASGDIVLEQTVAPGEQIPVLP